MEQAGLDGLLLASPLNVYYATAKTLVIERFSSALQSAALVPADRTQPIRLIASGFDVYFGGSDSGLAPDVEPYLVGLNHVDALGRPLAPVLPLIGTQEISGRERRRRATVNADLTYYPTFDAAASRALRAGSLDKGCIGVDGAAASRLLSVAAPEALARSAEDLVLHIRAVKTPDELTLIEAASRATFDAVLEGAQGARSGGGLSALRQKIFAGLCRRGLTPVHGNVDGVADELYDDDLCDGQSLMLDFVGHLGFYQSDIGRTLFLGEPTPEARRAAQAIETVWEELRASIRPGLTFSQLHNRGAALLAKIAPDLRAAFNPHLVGLQHWDQPRQTLDGGPLDLALEIGMVLSIDCPLLGAGIGGSIHMEDLMVVTADGATPLHPTGHNIISA